MIVCICHDLRERDVAKAREAGHTRVGPAMRFLGVTSPQCGRCANWLLDELRGRDPFPWGRCAASADGSAPGAKASPSPGT